MSALKDILAPEPTETTLAVLPSSQPDVTMANMPPPKALPKPDETNADTPKEEVDDATSVGNGNGTRRNANGSVSSVYSGNKVKHLKKEDGIPLWRKDIQYDFLHLIFYDQTKCFTKYSDGTTGWTFAETYIDAMAKSSKCSKILKEKLLQDTEGAIAMAMVCLLVNVGRMNTTLNFFPEMRAQLRTYHSIPALQANQDPNAYKQLQDAPRLKSILKGATEDEPQPSTMDELRTAKRPRTNPVNLIFVMSQYAPKISEMHFNPPRDFFDLVMRGSLSSVSRAKAFLWLIWWYLESDYSLEDSQRNPFGKGEFGEGEEGTDVLPLKVPALESLTEEQAALENIDTEDEQRFGETKRKERIAILASEPSPAMTALKRARKEKGLTSARDTTHVSDDEMSEPGWYRRDAATSAVRPAGSQFETGSEYTRSPSPAASRGFQAVNASKPPSDMRINDLLNHEAPPVESPSATTKKGPGRGNWRRSKHKQETVPLAVRGTESAHHVPLLPNNVPLSFVNEAPLSSIQPATPGSGGFGAYSNGMSHISPQQNVPFHATGRDHVPTPSYQAQKRNRGVTQHQSALMSHRKAQIDYMLDRRLRIEHARARKVREAEGAILRAWKRIRYMPAEYDSEEEIIRVRKLRDRSDKDDDWRMMRGKDVSEALEDIETLRRPKVLLAGMATVREGEAGLDMGEEPKAMAKTLRKAGRRLERWQDNSLPGQAMIRRRHLQAQGSWQPPQRRPDPRRHSGAHEPNGLDNGHAPKRSMPKQRSSTGRASEHRAMPSQDMDDHRTGGYEPDDDDRVGELDEEERELLGEVDATDEDEDEDEEMGED
ncbi:hypothetical protein LTR78_002600 [Recurvomyces mirabilis]|uniref:Ino eighty subunit 1 n=1 Tax=Recurvomyces mirabilis TaxID=574656 RepID=A0AAE0WUC4_9PEZI|nr:hypothetical protein LTR78_002600 [Recurvomyces mirabilis]KAK5157529.1 hypothetical protein LTS14_004294 [Recurvomyces mirabilis]